MLNEYRNQFIFSIILLLLILNGCTFKSDADFSNKPRISNTEHWKPKPVAVRIYPSTRFVVKDSKQVLEARIELFDEMGDSIKGAGWVSFELLEDIGPVGSGAGTQLYTWDIDLTSLHAQRLYYDPISRGYLLQLLLDEREIAKKGAILKVVYTPTDGKRLIDQKNIR